MEQENIQPTAKSNGNTSKNAENELSTIFSNTRILTGSAERLLNWYKINKDGFTLYELFANLIGLKNGTLPHEKIILVRTNGWGPVVQVVFYDNCDFIQIENFDIGVVIRCVGHMTSPSTLRAYKIRNATPEEVGAMMRMMYISEKAVVAANTNHIAKS